MIFTLALIIGICAASVSTQSRCKTEFFLSAIGGEEGKVRVFDVTRSSGVGKVRYLSVHPKRILREPLHLLAAGRRTRSIPSMR